MHRWTTNKHELTKTHHGLDLGKSPLSPLQYNLCRATRLVLKCHFVPGLPSGNLEISKVGIPATLWGPITLCVDLWLKWGLKTTCNPRWDLFNGMWHATCTQRNMGNSKLLVVGSQWYYEILNFFLSMEFIKNNFHEWS